MVAQERPSREEAGVPDPVVLAGGFGRKPEEVRGTKDRPQRGAFVTALCAS